MKRTVLVAVIVVVAVAAGYLVAARGWGLPPVLGSSEKQQSRETTLTYSLGQFITNLMDSGRFIRVTLDLEVTDANSHKQLEAKTSELKTDIYALLRSKTYEELVGEEGLRNLQQGILDRIEVKCPGMVREVFFSEFIIQ